MSTEELQSIITRTCAIATREALSGRPLESITYIPQSSVTGDPRGSFVLVHYNCETATDTPPWEKNAT